MRTNSVSTVAQVALSSQISSQSCIFTSQVVFFFFQQILRPSNTSPYTRMRTFSRCVSHFAHFIQCTSTGSRCVSDSVCLSKIIPPRTMSLLGVTEFFALVLSSSTPLTGIRLSCGTPLFDGSSGHLADPTQNLGYEPKICTDVSGEHAPINLPSRTSSFQLENDATWFLVWVWICDSANSFLRLGWLVFWYCAMNVTRLSPQSINEEHIARLFSNQHPTK